MKTPYTKSILSHIIFSVSILGLFALVAISSAAAQTSGTPSCDISATQGAIAPGASTQLSWNAVGADTFTLSDGLGTTSSAISGTQWVTPTTTTTYTGTVETADGSINWCYYTVQVLEGVNDPADDTSTISATTSTTTTTPPSTAPTSSPSITVTPVVTSTLIDTTTSTPALLENSLSLLLQSTMHTTPAYPAPETTPAPMVLDVSANGEVLIRGVVEVVDPNTMTITGWGGHWTIRTNGTTSVIPEGPSGSGDLSSITDGDFVGITGYMAFDEAFTIDATFVRDWTTHPYDTTTSDTDTSMRQSTTTTTGETSASSAPAPTESDTSLPETTPTTTDASPATGSSANEEEDEPGFFDSILQ